MKEILRLCRFYLQKDMLKAVCSLKKYLNDFKKEIAIKEMESSLVDNVFTLY